MELNRYIAPNLHMCTHAKLFRTMFSYAFQFDCYTAFNFDSNSNIFARMSLSHVSTFAALMVISILICLLNHNFHSCMFI